MHLYIITFLFKHDWLLSKETYSVSIYMCPPGMHKMLVVYGKFLHWCLCGHVFYLASPFFLFLHITSEWLTKHRCCGKVKRMILNTILHFAVLLNRHLWESIKHSWEKWFLGRQADTSPYKYTCIQWLHQDNDKILKPYAHSLEKKKKKPATRRSSLLFIQSSYCPWVTFLDLIEEQAIHC